MKIALRFLPPLGFAALCLALPYARAVTVAHEARVPRQPALLRQAVPVPQDSSLPCAPLSNPATSDGPFPVHLLAARSMIGPPDPTYIRESLWLTPNQVISVMDNSTALAVFDSTTGKQTPLDAVNALYQHQEGGTDPFTIRISPDGRWLLWPGGSEAEPIWEAMTLDGQERREWPRTTFMGQPAVAWMQDNRHWVELSEFDINPSAPMATVQSRGLKARVYDTQSAQVKEYPLTIEGQSPQVEYRLPQDADTQFTFTQDGHAWVSMVWGGASPIPQFPGWGSRLDAYEVLPGQSGWTLRQSFVRLGTHAEVGTCDECVRSPDDNWLVWRNYAVDGKGPMRLVLTQTDGSNPQVIHTSPEGLNFGYIHWAADSQHVAFYQGNAICQLTLTDLEAKASRTGPCSSSQIAGRVKAHGKFPVVFHQGPLTAQLSKAASSDLK